MTVYKYLRLTFNTSGVYVYTSHKSVGDQIIRMVKSIVPTCFDREEWLGSYRLYALDNKDREIGSSIIHSLLEQGWEPFAVTGPGQKDSSYAHHLLTEALHFRKVEEIAEEA